MAKVLITGNEALAESCLRAGCRFFSGYPITPQSAILEYLSWRMDELGGNCVQTESELAGINMLLGAASAGARALTTTSGPGFSLKQEGISYLCASDVPAVIADIMRIGAGLGDIFAGQGDYWQITRGGGHGDYRTIVLAPASVQETADLAYMSFDLAEKYRHPVIIATDGAIGEMIESVELPEMKEHDIDTYDWAIRPRKDGEKQRVIWNRFWDLGNDEYPIYLVNKYNEIEANEQRWVRPDRGRRDRPGGLRHQLPRGQVCCHPRPERGHEIGPDPPHHPVALPQEGLRGPGPPGESLPGH